ncbi:hypothetical protein CALCODRAFT_552296 [Calocera cornea HHB12733]|uniref:ferric-chelate reductase (NADPH) n=1 Tax=Calocera cornea HHB12733 TaxID=1353952 RepID=A0A165K757_9BASI|nr:hypothetical protein CALCODRAFT_552296 [Calocera cornea HHB12733]
MSSPTRTGGGGTRTGSRAASETDTIISTATSAIASAITSATRNGGHNAASQTSSSAISSATSTSKGGNANNSGDNNAQTVLRNLQRWMLTNYPLFQWWLIGAMGGVLVLLYILSLARGYVRRRKSQSSGAGDNNPDLQDGEIVESGRDGVRSYRNVPAAVSTVWNKVLYRFTIPTSLDRTQRMNLGEAIFCVGYVVSCLMFGFINNEGGPNSFANRTGWLAYAQTPFIVGLAGKNNVISFVTGIGPEKLNVLHRTAGRSVLILSLAHTFAWVDLGLSAKHAIYTPATIWGCVALVSFFTTWLLSFRFIRKLCYEFFLISHISLICFFLAGCILHKKSAAYWIYPSFALWASDRVARLVRLVLLNRLWLSAVPSSSKSYTQATVQAYSDQTVKITMRRKMGWRAGQHCYLVVPGISRLPWEAHPFTLASAPAPRSRRAEGPDRSENELTFLVRARDGFTKRLLEHASHGEGGQDNVLAFVDGPYGMPPDLLEYSTVVLIGGGSGISYTLSQLSHIVQYHPIRASAVKRVCFVWVIRQHAHMLWVDDPLVDLLTVIPSGLDVQIKIFVSNTVSISSTLPVLTGESMEKSDDMKDISASSIKSSLSSTEISGITSPDNRLLRFPQVQVRNGRPDVPALIKEEVDISHGPVSVNVCGPNSLARTVRSTLTRNDITSWGGTLRGRPEVELHVEQFGW